MSIRSTLIVVTAIATVGLSSPAVALGGWDNDTGNLQPFYAGHGRRFSVGDPVPAASPGGMSNEMMKARQNGYVARSRHCDYRDFHVWDQTYHCNEENAA